MVRLRSAPSAPPLNATQTATATTRKTANNKRAALREKTNTTRSTRAKVSEKASENDAGSFVKEATKPRNGRTKRGAQNSDELVMAGGLGQQASEQGEDGGGAPSHAPMATDELAKSDAPPPPSAKPNRRPPRMTRKAVHNEAQSKVLDGLKKRMEVTARDERATAEDVEVASESPAPSSDPLPTKPVATTRKSAAAAVERSEFSISPSPPPPGKLQFVSRRTSLAPPGSVLRAHDTPGGDNTILALKNFKRRPRQGSMLAMVQQRTASARPSLATARPQEDSSVFDMDDLSDEEDFAPEVEGTPAQLSKAERPASAKRPSTGRNTATPATAKSSSKRKSYALDTSTSSLSALRNKRRKLEAILNEEEPLPNLEEDHPQQEASSDQLASPDPRHPISEIQVLASSPASSPPTDPPSATQNPAPDEPDFAIPSTEQAEQNRSLQAAEQNSNPDDPLSSLSSSSDPSVLADPMTQSTPTPPPEPRINRTKQKPKPALSTATLQSLLPKRRVRPQPRDARRNTELEFESDGSEEAEDDVDGSEDELVGRGRARRRGGAASRKSTVAKGKGAKAKHKAQLKPSTAPPKGTRKRGKSATADKENERPTTVSDDEDDNEREREATTPVGRKGGELEAARRKFEEVDEWDLSFESISHEDEESSLGWR